LAAALLRNRLGRAGIIGAQQLQVSLSDTLIVLVSMASASRAALWGLWSLLRPRALEPVHSVDHALRFRLGDRARVGERDRLHHRLRNGEEPGPREPV